MNISLSSITVVSGRKTLLNDLSLTLPSGEISVITGANGCGKSTLLRTAAGIIKPKKGTVFYGDNNIADRSAGQLAQMRAMLMQNPFIPAGMSVNSLLRLSRFARNHDPQAILRASEIAGCTGLFDRKVETLSGGEIKRVFLALALAQETEILFLDEPEANCDADFRSALPALLKKLCRERNLTIVMVMHDLDLALHCADNLIGMNEGKICFASPVDAPDFLPEITAFAGKNYSVAPDDSGTLRAAAIYR